jgi:hypothetical protein
MDGDQESTTVIQAASAARTGFETFVCADGVRDHAWRLTESQRVASGNHTSREQARIPRGETE